MPYEVTIDRVRGRVTVVGHDPFTLADALALIDRQADDGAWSFATLHDARAVTSVPTVADAQTLLEHIVEVSRVHGVRGPVAFVTTQRALFGVLRLYECISEGAGLRVTAYSNTADAERWLDSIAHEVP
jgi:hypothetical protein